MSMKAFSVVALLATTTASQAIFSMDEQDVPILTDESFLGFDPPPPSEVVPPPSIA